MPATAWDTGSRSSIQGRTHLYSTQREFLPAGVPCTASWGQRIVEAALIGLFFHTKHAKKTYAAIIVYILLFSAFDATLLKAFSYILYYTFHVNMTAGKSLMDYLAYNYSFYLKSGIASNFIVVLFSLTAAVMAGRFIFWLCMEKGGCRETKL